MPAEDIDLYAKWKYNRCTITYDFFGDWRYTLPVAPLHPGETIVGVSSGSLHSSLLTSFGRVFTWGRNADGQLGDGTTNHKYTPTDITDHFGLSPGETIAAIFLRAHHCSALTSYGRIFTWGRNASGELGDGTAIDRCTPTDITSSFGLGVGETIIGISLGFFHVSACTSTGRLFTWGRNITGQLRDGTTIEKSTPTEISSVSLSLIQSDAYDFGDAIIDFTPVLEGYQFVGWYYDLDLTQSFTLAVMPAYDIRLYGKWIPTT